MALAQSKITAQGQISVPKDVRKMLGVGPGSVLEWEADGDRVIVRKVGRYSFEDMRKILFPQGPPPKRSDAELREGIRQYVRKKYGPRRSTRANALD